MSVSCFPASRHRLSRLRSRLTPLSSLRLIPPVPSSFPFELSSSVWSEGDLLLLLPHLTAVWSMSAPCLWLRLRLELLVVLACRRCGQETTCGNFDDSEQANRQPGKWTVDTQWLACIKPNVCDVRNAVVQISLNIIIMINITIIIILQVERQTCKAQHRKFQWSRKLLVDDSSTCCQGQNNWKPGWWWGFKMVRMTRKVKHQMMEKWKWVIGKLKQWLIKSESEMWSQTWGWGWSLWTGTPPSSSSPILWK